MDHVNLCGSTLLDRRRFLGATLAVSATLGCSRTKAATLEFEVDTLSIRVLDDSATFGPFLPDLTLPGLKVIQARVDAGRPVMSPRALTGEFGLSLLTESRRAGVTVTVLIDFGYSPETVRNNLALLSINPQSIDAAVLSHGHLDHYGGFPGFFGDASRRRMPLYVGGEEAFCERLAMIGDPPPLMGTLDRAALRRAGFDVRLAAAPAVIMGQALTTGIIPLKSFERAAIPTQMRPGKGCDKAGLAPAKRDLGLLPDDGEHELATFYILKNLGLVVIASCSHRGVINSIRQAQAISGINKVHAVVGGFHLVRPRTEVEARQTVAELAAIDPRYILPMHCTGEVFIEEAMRVMPDKIIRSYVGTEFLFAA
ncbi:MBL fold metallo-hydrolase [Sandarakinorhabdus sp.]|uniref:MBL fold metallo-hydrolase n=1 Tax=Sandarakinorhabdus sp. TaxID=1916663 RepID=UPI00286E5478|nr:MBL fold metallo-hydrolase [Sandarakinorhabdus sp.]